MERWCKTYGQETLERICRADNMRPALTLRANVLRCSAGELAARFGAAGIECMCVGPVVQLLQAAAPERLPGYDEGVFSVQDAAAVRDRLIAAGATLISESGSLESSLLVFLRDPWGVTLQLCQRSRPLP